MKYGIEMALNRIVRTIPEEILDITFAPRVRGISLDRAIELDVIQRVKMDCDLVAGKPTIIRLRTNWIEYTMSEVDLNTSYSFLYVTYRIPPEAREHRPISSVIRVEYPILTYNAGVGFYPNCAYTTNKTMQSLARSLLIAAAGGVEQESLPVPLLLAGDIVRLNPSTSVAVPGLEWILNCMLEYDKEFTNLNPSAVNIFMQLIEQATKAHIYNHLDIKLDQRYVLGGMEIGRVRDRVDSYSDAQEKYDELLMEFHGYATLLDKTNLKRIIYGAL